MTEPVASYGGLSWWGNFAEYGFLTKLRSEQLRDIGATLSPHSAFLLLMGVETLPQRMREHVANAQRVAAWLEADERCLWVRYSGLPSHSHHALAQRYLPEGPVPCSPSASPADALRENASSTGPVVLAPGEHRRRAHAGPAPRVHDAPAAVRGQLQAAGVPADLIRISVGLEDVEDVLWDLDQALAAAVKGNS